MGGRCLKGVQWATTVQENKEARTLEAGFFLRERRYANLGHLLPTVYFGRAVKPGTKFSSDTNERWLTRRAGRRTR